MSFRGGRDRRARNAVPSRTPRRSSSALVVQSLFARAAAWTSTTDAIGFDACAKVAMSVCSSQNEQITSSVSALRRSAGARVLLAALLGLALGLALGFEAW